MEAKELRNHLARWATGVTVITAMDRAGVPLGKAANSFHAVSIAPPLVAWCVDVASTRYDEWLAAEHYAVHVLGIHQEDLVKRFSTRGGDKFDELEWTSGPGGTPLLDSAHLRVICRVVDRHPAGDHTYLIGEVLDIQSGDQTTPLLFHGGKISHFLEPQLIDRKG
ncbi:flavin reductase family protein [Enemella sp. A6]|uniref:flavin reductase family protein n=1 Tax=Enemella sp. A6 TaxID=3440152 RepID=UPI003EC09DEF